MSEENQTNVQVEGTRFYKRGKIADIMRITVITVVVIGMLFFLALWFVIDSGARRAYKEARDIRKALRLVGTEYYGDITSIYDPDNATGLTDGAAEKIAYISQRTGDVILHEWDDEYNIPLSFEYNKGLYRVVYKDTGSENDLQLGTEGTFRVYYSFELLKYEAE